jgi:NAD(P)-dependent dehydrogenase (short-subunit alcohol dehydrogenase family)
MTTGWLRDRVAVVTGASRGIGLGTARALAQAGANVILAARSGGRIDEAAATLTASGCTAEAVSCDVSSEADVERLFTRADELGPLSVLVCAAGILEKRLIDETPTESWQRTLDVNLTGTFLCARRAFASMRATGGGRIVTLGSLSGVYATEKLPGLGAYNVSKYGIVGLTESLAVEGRDHNISAVCVSPGAVDTEMLRAAAPHLNPGLTPDDVGKLIVALLDEDLAPLSGANIPLFSNR